jgi:hypothetical protein
MSPASALRVSALVLVTAILAVPAAAQIPVGPSLAIGTAVKYGEDVPRKNWITSAVFPVGGPVGIEIEGNGMYLSLPYDELAPGFTYFSRTHGVQAGVRVAPAVHDLVRPFGHLLVGYSYNQLRGGVSFSEPAISNNIRNLVATPGFGIDLGSRRVAARLQVDRTYTRMLSSSKPIGDDEWFGLMRVSAFLVIGFGN